MCDRSGTSYVPSHIHAIVRRLSAIAVSFAMATPMSGQLSSVDSIPQIGEIAPDFGLRGATRYGVLQNPVRLSDFRGQTVVLAFFSKAFDKG
jgi:peroxiredoxin Q/BCP